MAATGAKPVRAKILKAIRARISYNGSREFLRTAAAEAMLAAEALGKVHQKTCHTAQTQQST